MQQNKKRINRVIFTFCNCPQSANLSQFFKFICKPIFFPILYRDACIGDTSIGIDLTPQSIVYRYRLSPFFKYCVSISINSKIEFRVHFWAQYIHYY